MTVKSSLGQLIVARGISLDRLGTFCRVVEAGSIAAAAEGDSNRQSQYSRQIKQLEESLEKRLFTRKGRTMRLNEDGRQLALIAQSFFASVHEFAWGGEEITVRIGTGDSAMEAFWYPHFAAIRKELPRVRFELLGMPTAEIFRSLRDGTLELGLCRAGQDLADIESETLGSVTFEWVVPRSLLPQGNREALDQVSVLPIATLAGTGRFVQSLLGISDSMGIKLDVIARVDSFHQVASMVQAGSVAGVLPKQLCQNFDPAAFARIHMDQLQTLERTIVLAASEKARILRPRLGRIYDRLLKNLMS